MPFLTSVKIKFDTHDDDKNDSTWVSVFVKNRLNNSLTPDGGGDFISNWLDFQRYQDLNDLGDGRQNPYLACAIGLGDGETFDDPSSHEFELTLRSNTITADEIVMPAVDIHILTDGDDRWIFDYTVTLTFDNHAAFSFTSKVDGVSGIILDQDNHNYSGIGVENPLSTVLPVFPKPVTDSVLKKVTLEFNTHNDNKDDDTRLNVHIVNRISENVAQDLAIGLNLFPGQEFPDDGSIEDKYRVFTWSADEGTLPSNEIRLADMVLPIVYIIIMPNGDDRWIFDYRVTLEFGSPEDFADKRLVYSSQTNGVILDQDNNKHAGAWRGTSFPTVSPPTAPPLTIQPVDHTGNNTKFISLDFLNQKLHELIYSRSGVDTSDNPPLFKVRLASGLGGMTRCRKNYVDTLSATAGKITSHVDYVSGPVDIGQIAGILGSDLGEAILNDIHSTGLKMTVDPTQPAPVTVRVDFAPFNPVDYSGSFFVGDVGLERIQEFYITLLLTLDLAQTVTETGATRTVVDAMSWIPELQAMTQTLDHTIGQVAYYRYRGTFLHQPVDLVTPVASINDLILEQVLRVFLHTDSDLNPLIRTKFRDQIYDKLTSVDVISKTTKRDSVNSTLTSWLLGGVADDPQNTDGNNVVIESIKVETANPQLGIPENRLKIAYRGPRNVFVPKVPADWPTPGHPNPAHDFSPGTLANIDHIIVLTKENRSFDHLLGYLSLPVAKGGMGRQDVDGLKGGEYNVYQGQTFPIFEQLQTRFAPGPPNDYEGTHRAINGGLMDGFAQSEGEAYGLGAAGRVMGYYTGATVSQYDALVRDFAIGHRWFCSHPGPTFPNRFYELTGRPNLDARGFWELDNSSPMRPVFTPTIFDYLSAAVDPRSGQAVTWRYYERAYCTLRFYERYTFDHTNIVEIDDPEFGFFAAARSGQLPSVSFIDPHFVDYPPDSTCDEPPSDIVAGQTLVQQIVEAVVAGPAWNKTLLVVVYDEHGGFYDHVTPSAAAQVSPELPVKTHGVRVPAIVISPWVAAGAVFGHDGITESVWVDTGGKRTGPATIVRPGTGLHFDHTSILKTIARRFLTNNPPYMGGRFAAAHDLSEVLGNQLRQPQFLPFIRYNLQYVQSQMLLSVYRANPAPGTRLLQLPADATIAQPQLQGPQDFSFEDAGDGFVYIRCHVSNLYVTVREPGTIGGNTNAMAAAAPAGTAPAGPAPAGALRPPTTTSAGARDTSPAAPIAPQLAIIQDRKYAPPRTAVGVRPALQKWKLSPVGITILDRDLYVISNEAYPSLFLQPAVATQSGSAVVLGAPGAVSGAARVPSNTWSVTSPLISNSIVNA